MRHSALQKQVLKQYKQFLRLGLNRSFDVKLIKMKFRQEALKVGLKDFEGIEFLLRRGEKTLESMKNADAVSIS